MSGRSFPPAGYRRWRQAPHDVVALESVANATREAIEEAGSLHAWASSASERRLAGGRGPAWRVVLGGFPAAVRHYRRGGWMAPVLGDRYLDAPPRPFRELAVSETLRGRGVATPRVLVAAATRAGIGYRADLATEWLGPGHDLAALLRAGTYPAAERHAALVAAGREVGRAHAAGLDHPDLQLGNLFLRPPPEAWRAWLLDLDRARIRPAPSAARAEANLARLERSLAKAVRQGRIAWDREDARALLEGHRTGWADATGQGGGRCARR